MLLFLLKFVPMCLLSSYTIIQWITILLSKSNTWPAAKEIIWSVFKKIPIEFQDIATIEIHKASFEMLFP